MWRWWRGGGVDGIGVGGGSRRSGEEEAGGLGRRQQRRNHLFARLDGVWNTRHHGTKANWSLFKSEKPSYRLSFYLSRAYRDPTVQTTQYIVFSRHTDRGGPPPRFNTAYPLENFM